jgi:hypothetical protein
VAISVQQVDDVVESRSATRAPASRRTIVRESSSASARSTTAGPRPQRRRPGLSIAPAIVIAHHGTIRPDGVDDNLKHGIGSGSANGSTSDAKCGYLRSPRTKPIPPPSGSPGRGTFALPGTCSNPA